MNKKKICVIGSGAAARALHIPAWRGISSVEVTAVVDLNFDLAKSLGKSIGAQAYARLEDLRESEVDIVDICTPTNTHFPLAKLALSKGFNVITEKPMCVHSKDGQTLIATAEKKGLKIGVVQHFIYSKVVTEAKRILENGELGNDVVIEVSFPITYFNPAEWSANLEQGGLLWEHGIHPSYIINYLMGEPEEVKAIGQEPGKDHACSISAHLKRGNLRGVLNLGPFGRYTLRMSGTKREYNARLVADNAVNFSPYQPPFYDGTPEDPKWNPYLHSGARWAFRDMKEGINATKGYMTRALKYKLYGIKSFDQMRLFRAFASWVEGGPNFESTGLVGVGAVRTLERIRQSLST